MGGGLAASILSAGLGEAAVAIVVGEPMRIQSKISKRKLRRPLVGHFLHCVWEPARRWGWCTLWSGAP